MGEPREDYTVIPLMPGITLGRYVVIEQVGLGAVARVFRARDTELERDVALKVLPTLNIDDTSFAARFKREARAIAQLSHPSVLPVYDFGEDKGFTYIVTKLVPGGTLQERKMGRGSDLGEVLRLVTPLAKALEYAHHRGIIHRDIKPSNILLEADGTPVLADFGIARILEANSSLTGEGVLVGTPSYISPEQVLGRPADTRSDLYSFAVVIYELVVGRPVFDVETSGETLLAHVHAPVVPPTQIDPELDPGLDAVLLKALAKDPDDRYQTPGELVGAMGMLASPRPDSSREGAGSNWVHTPLGPPSESRVSPHNTTADEQPTEPSIRVFLIEDHPVVLEGLPHLIESEGRVEVVGAAQSAEEALPRLKSIVCDVVITDIGLPGMSGIEVIRQIKAQPWKAKVLVLSGYGESHLTDAISAGADGYIMKSAGGARLRQAINDVHGGGSAIDPKLARNLFQRIANTAKSPQDDTTSVAARSDSEE